MSEEIWKPYPFRTDYLVSDQGRVRGPSGKILKFFTDKDGYRRIGIRDPKFRKVNISVVVATTFHGPRPDGLEIRHLNGNPSDDRASNVRWGTRKENMDDQYRHGTRMRGARSNRTILTESDIPIIFSLYPQMSQVAIAKKFGVGSSTICEILNRNYWKHVEISSEDLDKTITKRLRKLTDDEVRYIRTSPLTGLALAQELNVSSQAISLIRTGKTHKDIL